MRLCLRPSEDWPGLLAEAPFAASHALHRTAAGWSGAWRSTEALWPLPAQSVARIDLCFVLEHSDQPAALLAEAARVLCPEGRLLVLGLNPFAVGRWRWSRHGVRALPASRVARWLDAAGLIRLDERRLGPRWCPSAGLATPAQGGPGRAVWALLAVRRESTPTPLRLPRAKWRVNPGIGLA